jgi:hypothetical protein
MKEDLEKPRKASTSFNSPRINTGGEYSNHIRHPRFEINFNTKYNQELIDSYKNQIIPKKRKERMLPNIIGKKRIFFFYFFFQLLPNHPSL